MFGRGVWMLAWVDAGVFEMCEETFAVYSCLLMDMKRKYKRTESFPSFLYS